MEIVFYACFHFIINHDGCNVYAVYIMRMKMRVYMSNCSNPRVQKLKLGEHGA